MATKKISFNENIEFLQAFVKNPLKVGAIAPSSTDLARKMLDGLAPNKNNIIVELGVGTGAITKHIRHILPNEDSYLGIELDKDLVKHLRKKYSGLNFSCGNALEAGELHQKSGLGKVGAIICCLPFVTMPNEIGENILDEISVFMDKGCLFRTFQYAHGYYMPSAIKLREFMRKRYGKSKRSQMVVKNVPPAYTLTWETN